MVKKAPSPEPIQGTMPAVLKEAIHDVQLRANALDKAMVKLTGILSEYKPDTAAKAATALVGIEPAHKAIDDTNKKLGVWVNNYRVVIIPERFVAEQIKTVTLLVGNTSYRFSISQLYRASVVEGMKDKAIAWFKKNKYSDIVQETINASTLSAFAKNYVTEQGKDLPDDIFKVAQVPSTSVTKVQ